MSDSSTQSAEQMVRQHYRGVLLADDTVLPRNYVIDGATGRLVISIAALECDSYVMHIPDERHDALQLMVEPAWLDSARDGACDRLLIYHQRAETPRFAALEIVDSKWSGPLDHGLSLINRLRIEEPRLCRTLNQDQGRLGAIVQRRLGRTVIEPRAVGVDQLGIDIRTRTGIVRMPFDAQLHADQAIAAINDWMAA
ncbi:MAG: hypothetical protein U0573_00725 [Phycisphaerales bacterium]|nr:hypothetical protein [Planctomycetota bacterium]